MRVLTSPGMRGESNSTPELLPVRKPRFSDYRVAAWFTDPYVASVVDDEVLAILKNTVQKLRKAGLDVDETARPDINLWEDLQIWGAIRQKMMAGDLPLYDMLLARQKRQEAK